LPQAERSVLMKLNPRRIVHVDPLGKFRKREDIAKSVVQARQLQDEREAKMNGGKALAHKPCAYVSLGAKTEQHSAEDLRWMSTIPGNVMGFRSYVEDWRQLMPMSTYLALRKDDVIYFDYDELLTDRKPTSTMWLCEKKWWGTEVSARCTACGSACRSWTDLIAIFTGVRLRARTHTLSLSRARARSLLFSRLLARS